MRRDFLTPPTLPTETAKRHVEIPDDQNWWGLMNAALLMLTQDWRYEQVNDTDLDAATTAAIFYAVYVDYLTSSGDDASDLSPFWDDADGGDADGEPTDNTYSYTDRIEDWVIAAFVAASGVPGAAVAYLTIAPRFRLAFRTRDYGGIIRIFVDGVAMGDVDTYSATPGLTFFDVIAEAV